MTGRVSNFFYNFTTQEGTPKVANILITVSQKSFTDTNKFTGLEISTRPFAQASVKTP